ncbi:putative type VI secretion system effector [Xanthomonas oryzae]|uniref:putative type VI secretion system effector n=2 Tax=Xanthomonas oryzae TaxID=347 RepID=UPI001F341021|nr:putative type VI secretion system effector [Xanthomonas oryzae]UNE64486.1 hypothetical protein MML47_10585 [Xanthomonas oryzae]
MRFISMREFNKMPTQVLSGILSNVKVSNTTAEVFFRDGDREGMAATGAVAAALGLSGAAAGMVAMSLDEMSEPVSQVSFDFGDKHIKALLWNWPFKDGDEVQVVAELNSDGSYTGFAVSEPREKIIVLYPHVSAGGRAHWTRILRFAAFAGVAVSAVVSVALILVTMTGAFSHIKIPISFYIFLFIGNMVISLWVGYRIGKRFNPFINMAEPIFSALGWTDVKSIDLRKTTKTKKKQTDPPAMGDSYFRY